MPPSHIVLVPSQPSVSVVPTTATTISISWSVPSGSVVASYEVTWQRSSSVGSSNSTDDSGVGTSGEITDGSISYTMVGLEVATNYSITVRVSNVAGTTDSQLVYVSTSKEGEGAGICIPLDYGAKKYEQLIAIQCLHIIIAVHETDDTYTWPVVGGVVAVLIILSITTVLTVIVVVAVLKNQSRYVCHEISNKLRNLV